MAVILKPETEIEWATEPEWPKPRGPVATLLAKALDILKTQGWIRGTYSRYDRLGRKHFCAIGALNAARGGDGDHPGASMDEFAAARFLVRGADIVPGKGLDRPSD